MQRENKWLDRFDEEFPYPDVRGVFEGGDPYQSRRNSIKSFIQSEIDRVKGETRVQVYGWVLHLAEKNTPEEVIKIVKKYNKLTDK
jgi:hypothetical protein